MEYAIVDCKIAGALRRQGLHISLGFYHDILVPEYALQEPSFWDEDEQAWFWQLEDAETNCMFYEKGDEVRLKVHALKFNALPTPTQMANGTPEQLAVGTDGNPFQPMQVVGEMNGDGLGMVAWWQGSGSDEG